MFINHPKRVITFFTILSLVGIVLAIQRIRFNFDLEHFFPSGDEDLAFFLSFREKFEPDDNFLLIGVHREEGVFEQTFMNQVLQLSLDMRRMQFATTTQDSGYIPFIQEIDGQSMLSPVVSSNCLLQLEYPVKNPITGFTMIPFVHLSNPDKYEKDKKKILADERLVNTFISADAKTLVVAVKTIDEIKQVDASLFIDQTHAILAKNKLTDYHLLGRTNFQTEIVKVQIREFILSTVVSIILVFLVLLLIFRKGWGIFVAMISILVGLLMFTGYLGATASTLDTMALLYPIIMIIVATSDVIHVMSKYIDELGKGQSKHDAIRTTIREIGLSILLTSTTTAVGFLSLYTSRLAPVKMFGIHAAVGVMIAYVSVILFTTTILSLFQAQQITKKQKNASFWERSMLWFYRVTKTHTQQILAGFALLFIICGIGISLVTTNTLIEKILPKGEKVTADFLFFEKNFSGFRPLEIAVSTKNDQEVDDYKIVAEIDKLEQHFRSYEPIRSVSSIATLYKSINQAFYPTREGSFALPSSQKKFKSYQKMMRRIDKSNNLGLLVSKDKKHTRISARITDIGADSIKLLLNQSKDWINNNIDTSLIETRATGTGVIIDKNSEYVRDSLLKGLFFAILMISLFMALLYKNLKIIIIALIPNILPLIIAGALLGFLQIPLEAGVAIVFAIIFGIAVDDTIHLLSKFKLLKDRQYSTDEAIKVTLLETGKAVCLTSVILFFGFLILLFSSSPPAVTIGLLISTTLFSALFCDLLIIPIMLRKWLP